MASQTIVWITVPHGFGDSPGTPGRISVVVLPRLQPEAGVLGRLDFVDWPRLCGPGKIQFDVEFPSARVRARVVSQPESRLWQALFDAATFVRPHQLDANSGVFGSYPAARLQQDIKSGYQNVCEQSPTELPPPTTVTSAFGDVARLFDPISSATLDTGALTERQRERVLRGRELLRPGATFSSNSDDLVNLARQDAQESIAAGSGRKKFAALIPDTGEAMDRFVQLAMFHRQPKGDRTTMANQAADTKLDFHQRLTALGDYPTLMRQLGLVIELEVDASAIPEAELNAPSLVRVNPTFLEPPSHAFEPHLRPFTAYICKRGHLFAAAPRTADGAAPEIVNGLLNMRRTTTNGDDEFDIVQVDVDSAGLRTLDIVGRSAASADGGGAEPLKNAALSPLRTSGIAVARSNNANRLHDALEGGLERMGTLTDDATLFAEDLVRGYRVDIRDMAGQDWRSLHEREGAYKFLAIDSDVKATDEGTTQQGAVQPVADLQSVSTTHDPEAPNYVTESLFLWHGWSLAAPRPVDALEQPDGAASMSTSPESLGLETTFHAKPGSLPRLRFGRRYQVRARVVDLAGNSLTGKEADAALSSFGAMDAPVLPAGNEGFSFLRFEPIAAPVPVLRAIPQCGDAADTIVLRSNLDATSDAFTVAHPAFMNANERHIAPPKTFQLMAEMCGHFDGSIGTHADFENTYELASRESGSLNDGALAVPPRPEGVNADPVHPEKALHLTYLPDPLCAGVTFRSLPGMPEGTIARSGPNGLEFAELPLPSRRASELSSAVLIDFGPAGAWPNLQPFRLRLAEGADRPAWDAAERVLTVFMPKGEMHTVRMSCHPFEAELQRLGMWQWTADRLAGDERRDEFRQLALLGLLWMVTPYRELKLIHAVPKPVSAPVMQAPFPLPDKTVDGTFARIGGEVHVHTKSTGRIELMARWRNFGADPAPDQDMPVFSLALPLSNIARGFDATATIAFDALSGVLKFVAPNIGKLEAAIRPELSWLVDEAMKVVAIARRLPTPDEESEEIAAISVRMAEGLEDATRSAFGLEIYPRWQALIDQMIAVVGFSDMNTDGGPLQPHQSVIRAAEEVGEIANDVIATVKDVAERTSS